MSEMSQFLYPLGYAAVILAYISGYLLISWALLEAWKERQRRIEYKHRMKANWDYELWRAPNE